MSSTEYFRILGLEREPFMDTANPYFYYETAGSEECLSRLEVSLRLGRGLNLILGEVGSGKTTLASTLEQALAQDDGFLLGKILEPASHSERGFLRQIAMTFSIPFTGGSEDESRSVQEFLLLKSVEEGKTIVLIIDEGQKLTYENLEALRILLNYEVSDRRLLNLVILAQTEFTRKIQKRKNLVDRVSFLYFLAPLTGEETSALIDFRLSRAGLPAGKQLFTAEAKDLIHSYSGGKPRRIVHLCHEAVEEAVLQERSLIGRSIVEVIIQRRRGMDALLSARKAPARALDQKNGKRSRLKNGSLPGNGSHNGNGKKIPFLYHFWQVNSPKG